MEMTKEESLLSVEASGFNLDDLELFDAAFDSLNNEDAIGLPELGASYGISGCCTSGCM